MHFLYIRDFSHSLVLYQKSHSFAALTCSISVPLPTRAKILYARTFYEVKINYSMGSTFYGAFLHFY